MLSYPIFALLMILHLLNQKKSWFNECGLNLFDETKRNRCELKYRRMFQNYERIVKEVPVKITLRISCFKMHVMTKAYSREPGQIWHRDALIFGIPQASEIGQRKLQQ
jgi:hypothetical protein